ncbi:TonB-dependent receptor [Paraflavitalea sp. CAU 1676]|uniref:SusC/RagA family TonB-linked outer membrane protein n=1 Tax=Paraflavitalea sp. CAU 1676 TaxID=3032598 RepID=UPI0023DA3320|nr:TonB-dependent receptor [Paraflavitalea sp. CAU 1676]MDF2186911.1 TonB-dependent receptor [Paraflavitalea sp. CAU 1676]
MMPKRSLVGILMLLMCVPIFSWAQSKTVTGKITDASNGTPVAGASVTAKGSKAGTSSKADGSFSLTVPAATATLTVSGVGFESQQVPLAADVIVVALKASAANLNEVVVIGYGTQRRKDVTGAITKVNAEKLTSIAAPSFEAALQGKAPGVQVIQGSGLAGSGSVIRIRGIASISAGADPLYVIDGIPVIADAFLRSNSGGMNQNPLASINPNDIESVEILKDAAAAGIYGSRGSNGVILITTKRGKSGKPSYNYNNKIGISTYANKPDFVSGQEWLQLRQEAWENDGNTGKAPLPGGLTWDQAKNNNTDWWDELTRTGFINEHSLSMTQGNKLVKSFIGATYSDNQSYLKNNSYTRLGLRTNFDFTITPKFKANVSLAYNRGINKRVPAAWAGGLGDAMSTALPIYPIYNNDKTWFTGGSNPVRRLNETLWRNTDHRLIGGLNLDYEVIKNLNLRVSGSYDYLSGIDDQWESSNWINDTQKPGIAKRSPYRGKNWVASGTANYNWSPNDDNRFTFLAGIEFQEKSFINRVYVEKNSDKPFYKNKSLYEHALDSIKNTTTPINGPAYNAETFASVFGRVNYVYKERYALQASVRRDGSSKFGPNKKYGVFPTISAGWTISQEEFMKDLTFINFLKLRASYGLTGNSNLLAGRYYYTYYAGSLYNNQSTWYPGNIGNPDLGWEETTNTDLAIEFAVLNSRITGELAYYHKKTADLLLNTAVSPSNSFGDFSRNVEGGKILNQGIELSLNAKLINKKELTFSIGGNIAKNYNELISLGGLSADAAGGGSNDTRVVTGYPVGTNYLVRYYGVDPADGLPIWYDKAGKLTKTFSLDNRMPVGSVVPDFIGGLNHNLSYKGFDFSSLWTFTIGGNIYDGSGKRQAGVITDWTIRRDQLDRWREPGDVAKFPRLTMNTGTYAGLSSEWQYNSTMFLYDASYVRLRELSLGYRFSAQSLSKLHLRGARIFVTGMNLLTFTKYPGGDPEIARDFENATDRNLSPNITYLTPPQQKSWVVGINVTF